MLISEIYNDAIIMKWLIDINFNNKNILIQLIHNTNLQTIIIIIIECFAKRQFYNFSNWKSYMH
jgi:hypothetical protein